ncbi:hypothetical protein BTA51_09855 [Hahella sp. CCB-MM4]|uniref:hypothetical protein n=1 Tax=Hahella sp. (strain CCB-MM4) TaxID=1926491 RepID=UPI000B9BED65|nr:hypothetical protein [Hahella sp. CCB-MM4]OZG74064.1 hypothetical protein BTA51_09855 [Hahella sp. CCB-MM4]
MNFKISLLFIFLMVSKSAGASFINYKVSGIIEDDRNSTSAIFGGDGNTHDLTDDGSNYDVLFTLGSFDEPDSVEDYVSRIYYNYLYVDDVQFFLNGIKKTVSRLDATFSTNDADWNLLRLKLHFSEDEFFGITSIVFNSYGTDLFQGELGYPVMINSQNQDTSLGGGKVGEYLTRSLSIDSVRVNTVSEPGSIFILAIGISIFARRCTAKKPARKRGGALRIS